MNKVGKHILSYLKIAVGCLIFSIGYNLFLAPGGLNAGGITGLCSVLVEVIGFGSIGLLNAIINIPLFAIGGIKI